MEETKVFAAIVLATLALSLAFLASTASPSGGGSTTTSVSSIKSVTTSTSVTPATTSTGSTTTYTTFARSLQTSTDVSSKYDLELQLSLNASELYYGMTVQVNVTELNTLLTANNVSESSQWRVQATLSSCPNTNFQPFGIAAYSGYYTAQNVSRGTQLEIFPITACPMFVRLITGYYFQPNSDLATILPGSGLTLMTGIVSVTGTYSGLGQSQPLSPGVYTVAAADEWGALTFLYFQVSPKPVPVQ